MLVDGFISALNMPKDDLEKLRAVLSQYAGQARSARPEQGVQTASFGGSDLAGSLGHHAGLAEQALRDAVTNVVEGLRSHAEGIGEFVRDVDTTDETVGADLTLLRHGLERIQTPTHASVPPAGIPATEDGGA